MSVEHFSHKMSFPCFTRDPWTHCTEANNDTKMQIVIIEFLLTYLNKSSRVWNRLSGDERTQTYTTTYNHSGETLTDWPQTILNIPSCMVNKLLVNSEQKYRRVLEISSPWNMAKLNRKYDKVSILSLRMWANVLLPCQSFIHLLCCIIHKTDDVRPEGKSIFLGIKTFQKSLSVLFFSRSFAWMSLW